MDILAIPFPAIDPVAIQIGPFGIRWYGLAYVAGLLLGLYYMRVLLTTVPLWPGAAPLKKEQADDFLIWATVGTIVGGRLGFVLFDEPSTFISDPLKVFAVNQGGMAFHGGLLGVGAAIYLFSRVNKVPVLTMMDLTAAVVPFGLFFGRVANFINGEIYGRITDVAWAVDFPDRVLLESEKAACAAKGIADCGVRHPTQLYEAFLEGIVMFAMLRYLTHSRGAFARPGVVTGAFLVAYGSFRIFAEYFKEWDYEQFFTTAYFSEGMVYSLPMIALGLYFLMRAQKPALVKA